MLILVFIILSCLTIVGYYYSKDFLAPFVISPLVWVFILFLYFVSSDYTFNIKHDFPLCLLIWNLVFCITSFCCACITKEASSSSRLLHLDNRIYYIYVALSFILVPIVAFILIRQAYTEEPETFFRYLRVMNIGLSDDIEGPQLGIASYLMPICFITLFLVLVNSKNKYLITGIILINLLAAFVTMSKMSFLSVFCAILLVYYKKGKIRIRHIVVVALLFTAFAVVLQTLRGAGNLSNITTSSLSDFFGMYLLSSSGAFDWNAEPCSSQHFGENTFRFIYALGNNLGFTSAPVNTVLPFTGTPVYTNTYTILYPFYTDFGLAGIIVFAIIYGMIFGFFYKKSINGGQISIILYFIFLSNIILSFIGEFIFYNFSLQLQYIFYLLMPFLINFNNKTVSKK